MGRCMQNHPDWIFWKKRRHIVVLLGFFGLLNAHTLRANLSIAIVGMTENRSVTVNNETLSIEPEFHWNSKVKGYVLSSFFYGYMSSQFIGGLLSAKIGGVRLFGSAIAGSAILTLLTPWAARLSVHLLLVVRILMGIFQGILYPCIYAISSRWIPSLEVTKLLNLMWSGSLSGTIVSMIFGAFLTQTFGWPSVFYIFGTAALIWSLIWWAIITESPEDDPKISKGELELIQNSLGNIAAKRDIKHPWKEILTSGPVWAIIVANFADDWGAYTLLTELPTFMTQMFNFDLNKAGFLSALPYIIMAFMVNFFGQTVDWLREKKNCTTTRLRKLCTCTGFACNAIFLLASVSWLEPVGTVIFLILAGSIGVLAWSGFGVNNLDIAPTHGSVIVGLSNTAGCLAGICTPTIAGYIVTTPTHEEWIIVFCIASGILTFGNVIYGVFASGKLQSWASDGKEIQK